MIKNMKIQLHKNGDVRWKRHRLDRLVLQLNQQLMFKYQFPPVSSNINMENIYVFYHLMVDVGKYM